MSRKDSSHFAHRGIKCLNCGHPLDISDRFCPECSQPNSTKKLSLRNYIGEFFANLINYDSKLLKTLSTLLLRPGAITQDYIRGKRVVYTNPFRFLLIIGFIYFLIVNLLGDFNAPGSPVLIQAGPLSKTGINLVYTSSEKEKDSLFASGIMKSRTAGETSGTHGDQVAYFHSLDTLRIFNRYLAKIDFFTERMTGDSIADFELLKKKYQIRSDFENRMNFRIAGSLLKIINQPGVFLSSLVSRLPLATFFFLPLFAVFLTMAYIRKKYTYTDNLIFSFHNQSLLFILLIISFLIDFIFTVESAGIFLLIFAGYLYKSLRNYYQERRFKTILKFLFLNTIFFILAGIGSLLLILGSIVTY